MTLRPFVIGLMTTFALNLVWENAQAFLFRGYGGFARHFWICFVGTLGDLVIVAAIYGAVASLWRDSAWYRRMTAGQVGCAILLGIGVAIAIEAGALASGRWAYDGMPLIPFTSIGLIPILQMVILPPLIYAVMRLADPTGKIERER